MLAGKHTQYTTLYNTAWHAHMAFAKHDGHAHTHGTHDTQLTCAGEGGEERQLAHMPAERKECLPTEKTTKQVLLANKTKPHEKAN